MAWSLDDLHYKAPGVTMLTLVARATERIYYLNRAKAMLERGEPRCNAGASGASISSSIRNARKHCELMAEAMALKKEITGLTRIARKI